MNADKTRDEAIASLAECYTAVLRAFARDSPKPLLRLVPISSGIYAGLIRPQMADLTIAALSEAFRRLSRDDFALVGELPPHEDRKCELCLLDPSEVPEYAAALSRGVKQAQEVAAAGSAQL